MPAGEDALATAAKRRAVPGCPYGYAGLDTALRSGILHRKIRAQAAARFPYL